MFGYGESLFRLIIGVQLAAMGGVRAYYSAPRSKQGDEPGSRPRGESPWLTATLGILALLHFGGVFVYLANPSFLAWSTFEAAEPIQRIGILMSCLGAVGEIWAAIALGASYSPLLTVAEERVVVEAGPYRWIRHPLYAFFLPLMAGWGLAARNWFILGTGTILIVVLTTVRVPLEEAMMLEAFGESYRRYMTHTGRFTPRLRRGRGT